MLAVVGGFTLGMRCPLCAGLNHRKLSKGVVVCKLCCLGFMEHVASLPPLEVFRIRQGRYEFPNWNTLRTRLTGRPPANDLGVLFSIQAVRIFATHQACRVVSVRASSGSGVMSLPWSYGGKIQAHIEDAPLVAEVRPNPRLTLGVIAGVDTQQATLDLCVDMAHVVAEMAVVLDTVDPHLATCLENRISGALSSVSAAKVRVIARPLANDFAAQRNRLQEIAGTPWVLQLDSDERLSEHAKARLTTIVDDADRRGLDAVALPRRNMVDGQLSALYPDIQYRVLRRAVRFTRAVHEYPQLAGRASSLDLGSGIIHSLSSERLDRRAAAYETIIEGSGRPHDTALLRAHLEPWIKLPLDA